MTSLAKRLTAKDRRGGPWSGTKHAYLNRPQSQTSLIPFFLPFFHHTQILVILISKHIHRYPTFLLVPRPDSPFYNLSSYTLLALHLAIHTHLHPYNIYLSPTMMLNARFSALAVLCCLATQSFGPTAVNAAVIPGDKASASKHHHHDGGSTGHTQSYFPWKGDSLPSIKHKVVSLFRKTCIFYAADISSTENDRLLPS